MMRKIKYLVLHHTGGSILDTRSSIDKYQRSTGQYSEIAYNWFIDWKGNVSIGRSANSNAANLGLNSISLSLCLAGNFEFYSPSPEQKNALEWVIKIIQERYGILAQNIIFHCDCPSMLEFTGSSYRTSCCGRFFKEYFLSELSHKLK